MIIFYPSGENWIAIHTQILTNKCELTKSNGVQKVVVVKISGENLNE